MPAYCLVEIDIHNMEVYEEYKKLTPVSLEPFGGKFVIRGLPVEALEGKWNHDRLVLLEFPNREKALEWYNSENYQKAKKIRENASSANFFLVG
ncbi:uncharacterized protein (DUF1330 family) [Algoriphagus aquaeductus]|jgi:uncharacterized protein (DUF1330 family)|uniref:Uncharacterized protein (DUF1330 family) n=1 Tax=Algoriphagus aquaeductus TaxID=475299 RepID=A0A326RQZ2_9BACT|nr:MULTISPECIES: DUF1330 domain-containing protein [Algoriphagus]PZV80261.1 uncharacterized protein (DUF1330 family) [Algoriphagus aquaeductus]